jgi:hypothetical protein
MTNQFPHSSYDVARTGGMLVANALARLGQLKRIMGAERQS